ncbi:hypothetical protein D9757_013259 [Collybiopsis confluens]|uniref:Uncharacterized protein n=1 Tax=Collybiopsis confluens TaxID=2823264 RepID=A0A8H5GQJ8_9AGAR|nr:hypothetical protein D9757_013259 [Collybiopsis confluens]
MLHTFIKFTLKFARLLVVWELVIDTLHSTLLLYMIWQYLIDNFSNEAFLEVTPWSITSTAALTALSACPIQIYLSHRVKKLSGSWVVFTPLLILSLAEGSLGIATSTQTLQATKIDSYYNASRLVSIHIKNPVSVATDVSISSSPNIKLMERYYSVYALYSTYARNAPGFVVCTSNALRVDSSLDWCHEISETDHLVSRLVREAVETASFASVFSIMLLVTSIAWPSTQILTVFALGVHVCRGSLGLEVSSNNNPTNTERRNTFLAILNSREEKRRVLQYGRSESTTTDSKLLEGGRVTNDPQSFTVLSTETESVSIQNSRNADLESQ